MSLLKTVYAGCRQFNMNHDHRFENIFVHRWEADLFSVTKTGYCYEIEVKVSKSDFLADFKKPKHHLFSTIKNGYGILKDPGILGYSINTKHPHCNLTAIPVNSMNVPNVFYFAMPWPVIKQIRTTDIPDYAGLLHCHENGYEVLKKAPYIHKDKVDPAKLLFDKYYWKYEQLRIQNSDLTNRLEVARDIIKELEWKHQVV